MAKFIPDGAVELYYNNEKTFHTKENGVVVEGGQGDNAILELRADQGDDNNDYFRLHNESSFLSLQGYGAGSWTTLLSLQQQNQVRLFYNGSEKLNTSNTGVSISGKIYMNNGNLQFGNASNGIDFSNSSGGGSTSSLLDDYEQGTFTPKFGGTSNSSTYYVDGTGTYKKIGNVVTVQIRFNGVDLNNSASGDAKIFNMPFTAGRNPTNGSTGTTTDVQYYNVPFGTDNLPGWYITNASTAWVGIISRNNTSWVDFPISDFHASGLYVMFSGTYFTST